MNKVRTVFSSVMFALLTACATGGGAGSDSNAVPVNVAGIWSLKLETETGTLSPVLLLQQDGETVTGTMAVSPTATTPITGSVSGRTLKFSLSSPFQGQQVRSDYSATVKSDSMRGRVKFGQMSKFKFSGTKRQ
jgi:hypothetical protein